MTVSRNWPRKLHMRCAPSVRALSARQNAFLRCDRRSPRTPKKFAGGAWPLQANSWAGGIALRPDRLFANVDDGRGWHRVGRGPEGLHDCFVGVEVDLPVMAGIA